MVRRLVKYFSVGLFLTVVFLGGVIVCLAAAECDRGRVMLVNALDVEQPHLRLYSSEGKHFLLWSGSIQAGDIQEFFLQSQFGHNMLLEGTNAATGEIFSELSHYVTSQAPYGTYFFLIEPHGVRTIYVANPSWRVYDSSSVFIGIVRLALREIYYQTRCLDEDLARRWAE